MLQVVHGMIHERLARLAVGGASVVSRFLAIAAVVLGVVALVSSLYADVFFCVDRPLAYVGLIVSLLCTVMGGAASFFSGFANLRSEGFRLWQPFRGGLAFIILQYFGWLFYGVSVTMYLVFTNAFDKFHQGCRSGTVTSVGCLAFASILTLLASNARFDGGAVAMFAHVKLIKTDNLVVVACLVASTVFSVLLEVDATILMPYRAGLTMSLFTINVVALCLVLFIGRRRFAGKKMFHPFEGGFYFVLMQSSGWAGVAVASFFFLRFAIDHMMPGMLVCVTFLHVSSTGLLLLSLDCFEEAQNIGLLRRFRLSPEMVALLLIGVVGLVTITVCDLAGVQHSFLYHFALLCQALVAPVVHVYASLTIRGYALWQPFAGGARFVLLHGIAWSVFALAHMVILLALWNRIYAVVAAASLFVLVTGALICASLHVFEIDERYGRRRPDDAGQRARLQQRDSPYFNGELITSLLMSVGGMLTLTVADLASQDVFRKAHICIFGVVVMLLAPMLAHVSGRWVHPQYALLRPFYGGADHVALQTVGWTVWGVMVVVFAILEVNLFLNEDRVPRGAPSGAGFAGLLSYSLIVASIPLFRPERAPSPDQPAIGEGEEPQPRTPRAEGGGVANPEDRVDWQEAAEEAQHLIDSGVVVSRLLRAVLADIAARHGRERLEEVLTPPMRRAAPPSPSLVHPLHPSRDDGMGFLAVTLSSSSLILGAMCELLCAMLSEPMRTAAVEPTTLAMSTACVGACLITHLVSGRRRYPHAYHWWMPFGGGSNFALLQTIGWALVSIHLSLMLSSLYALATGGEIALFAGMFFAIGFFGFAGHMFLVVSLSQFDVDAETMVHHQRSFLHRNSEWFLGSILTVLFIASISVVEVQWKTSRRVSVATAPFIFIGAFSLLAAVGLGWASVLKSKRMRLNGSSSSDPDGGAAATPPTAGTAPQQRPTASSYQVSMLTETIAGTVAILWVLQHLFSITSHGWIIGIALVAVLHHCTMLLTIVWHEHHSIAVVGWEFLLELAAFSMYSFHYVVVAALVYVGFFLKFSTASVLFFFAVNVLSFGSDTITHLVQVVSIVSALSDLISLSIEFSVFMIPLLLYTLTYRHGSGQGGGDRTRWMPSMARTCIVTYFDAVANYFSLRLVSDLAPGQGGMHGSQQQQQRFAVSRSSARAAPMEGAPKVLYGFHPHGVCPYTCLWGTMGTRWSQAHLPKPVVHVSSFLMAVPVVRDALLALGVVECTFDALRASRVNSNVEAMMIVPGGQTECTQPLPSADGVTLVTKHKGLFRFALLHGATLVPVFCFGETDIMGSSPLPTFQFWARHKLGITYPQLPHGRLLLPIPRRVPIYVAVGEGICVDAILDPRPTDVDELHAAYYASVAALFERHKAAAGYPNSVLTLCDR